MRPRLVEAIQAAAAKAPQPISWQIRHPAAKKRLKSVMAKVATAGTLAKALGGALDPGLDGSAAAPQSPSHHKLPPPHGVGPPRAGRGAHPSDALPQPSPPK